MELHLRIRFQSTVLEYFIYPMNLFLYILLSVAASLARAIVGCVDGLALGWRLGPRYDTGFFAEYVDELCPKARDETQRRYIGDCLNRTISP